MSTPDFFRSRLDQMIDLRHPLAVLSTRLPVRLMASLLYLKNSFNLSDEELVERWAENVQWRRTAGAARSSPCR